MASPQMRDPYFERTVVLLIHHDDEGALGIVVNREGQVSVGAVVERLDLDPPSNADLPTWWGGPVAEGAGFVLWRGRAESDEGWTVGDEIAVSPSVERLTRLVESGQRFHLALGHAGWGAHQLDGEIENGSWLFVDLDPDIVFDTPLAERYLAALSRLGLTPESVWMLPINE